MSEIRQAIDVLEFAAKIVGLKKNVTIDTGVFRHNKFYNNGLIDETEDIIIILGSEDEPIELSDVLKVFKKMKKQFEEIENKHLNGRTFWYSGLKYDTKQKRYGSLKIYANVCAKAHICYIFTRPPLEI